MWKHVRRLKKKLRALIREHGDSKATKNKVKNPVKSNTSKKVLHNLENVSINESANPDNFQDEVTNTNENNLNIKENNSYICDHCGKFFEDKLELIAHIKAYTVGGASKTNLDINRPAFFSSPSTSKCATKSQLINHDIQTHHLKVNYISCNQCAYKTTKKFNLRRHIQTHSDFRHFRCTECDKKYKRNTSLTIHMRSHTGNRPYECNTCDAKFTKSSNLKVHQRIHSGEKPYECNECDSKFYTRNNLKVHLRIHRGEKPYECTTCDSKFCQNSSLTTHMRIHRGEKPYKCRCGSKFTTSSGLKIHQRIHSGEKPYKCTLCDSRFSRSYPLKVHMRNHN